MCKNDAEDTEFGRHTVEPPSDKDPADVEAEASGDAS
jgi:hypothetical protein